MNNPVFFRDIAKKPIAELILCHGAGAPADSTFMAELAEELVARDINVTRFELDYMAQRRRGGAKRPPPKIELLQQEWLVYLNDNTFALSEQLPMFIGGKSMGARLACMVASDNSLSKKPSGVVAFGYPFHPQNKPDKLRLSPLLAVDEQQLPTLIVQGTRDAFGKVTEVENYRLPQDIDITWLATGDHDFKPLKRSGKSRAQLISDAAAATRKFINRQLKPESQGSLSLE